MKITGVVQFQGMSASGINLLREFQLQHCDLNITFGSDLNSAIIEWESFSALTYVTRLAAAVYVCDPEVSRCTD